ncbi:MAG TPA: hypothetical protein PL020_01165 [Candidatus Cloacimonadota bacterium]|nr:hypothetical protein [Candidatus Cloacimonadota bacterium]
MKQLSVLILSLILASSLFGLDSRNRFSVYSDLSKDKQALGGLWAMEVSQDWDWQALSIQGEYSLYSRYQSTWEDKHQADMSAESYRAWISLGIPQTEFRIGLQRLNFGSAQILRPLQWFDTLDPLDSHQYTSGVQAALFRHHWLNNANLWIWGILGDESAKGNELVGGVEDRLEYGGRLQYPIGIGELGLSYHQRELAMGREHRGGIDLRMDYAIGIWFETSVSQNIDQAILPEYYLSASMGADYNFGIGNGLAIMAEQMQIASGTDAGDMNMETGISAVMLSYPINLLDSIKAVGSYDYKSSESSLGAVWERMYDYISLELSAKTSSSNGSSLHGMISAHF